MDEETFSRRLISVALLGVDFPPLSIALLGLIEYPLFFFGLM